MRIGSRVPGAPRHAAQRSDAVQVIPYTIDVHRISGKDTAMILSYRDGRTQAFAEGRFVREFSGFARQAYRRLEILDAATTLDELRALRSNRLEAMKGDRAGQFSIRINDQWRVCFEWPRGARGPSNVEIVDYH
jgi:proteic killer suppression protein